MGELPPVWRFMRSRSGRGFLLHLGVCAALVRDGRLRVLLFQPGLVRGAQEQRKDHRAPAGRRLCHQLFGRSARNSEKTRRFRRRSGPMRSRPSTSRTATIPIFAWLPSAARDARSSTPPTDARDGPTIEAFAATPNPKPVSELLDVNGERMFRTVYPTLAREQSCVSCHNELQPLKAQWHLNDVMGAFVIDVPISPFLHTVMWQSAGIGVGLFLALALAGLTISLMHFRQLEALDASAAEARPHPELPRQHHREHAGVGRRQGRARSLLCPDQPHRRSHFRHRARRLDRQIQPTIHRTRKPRTICSRSPARRCAPASCKPSASTWFIPLTTAPAS